MTDQALVVVAHVDHQGAFFHLAVEGGGVKVRSHVGHIEGIIGQAIGHDLFPHFDRELQEALAIVLHGDLPWHIPEGFTIIEVGAERREIGRG